MVKEKEIALKIRHLSDKWWMKEDFKENDKEIQSTALQYRILEDRLKVYKKKFDKRHITKEIYSQASIFYKYHQVQTDCKLRVV